MVMVGLGVAVCCACLNPIQWMGEEEGVGEVGEEEVVEHWGSRRQECGPGTEDDCQRNLNWC